ncbi:alpha-hydroxy-acid oxidizing enzyme [Actinomycetospora sp. NBRC 106375]|uniref:alpha-hydroxy acid oxidase n=1 Tax=Actinomycetospora sp. NBRC 106375 TaxID=3032207 RepID=UPI00249FD866|nr:alpha-hydroxy acid oxidase [Actinomycetospora sp. NBRC 106375]GLZ46484.1 alpha-hydroxy-acid oxidizing enzyme [Actinomycetospora sp. NBRC 106375]
MTPPPTSPSGSGPRSPRTPRRLPRPSELRPLLRVARPELDSTRRRLARAHTVADLREIARRRTPRAVFDYTDGAAEGELSLRRARDTFASLEFRPSVLRDVSQIDTSTTLLGGPSTYPFAFAPTGFTRMMHHEGEVAVARVAGRLGVPHTLSTMGTTSPADLAAAAPDTRRWFQLYLWRDRAASEEVVRRAADAGNEAIMLTVDTPVGGARLRDAYNGLTIPPALTARTLVDMARHPHWWLNVLTTDPLEFAALTSWEGTVAELIDTMFDPALNLDDLAWLRSTWNGPLVVKGVQTVEDARRVVDAGADAVVVSNHGGRQLDRAPVPLETLPSVVAEVGGEAEVLLDTGIMSGADIVAAVALGASGCLVGRAYLYALMAGGERGVEHLATILTAEIRRTMALLGVSSVKDLTPDHVRL